MGTFGRMESDAERITCILHSPKVTEVLRRRSLVLLRLIDANDEVL